MPLDPTGADKTFSVYDSIRRSIGVSIRRVLDESREASMTRIGRGFLLGAVPARSALALPAGDPLALEAPGPGHRLAPLGLAPLLPRRHFDDPGMMYADAAVVA
jgi:hypothetical protein